MDSNNKNCNFTKVWNKYNDDPLKLIKHVFVCCKNNTQKYMVI